MPGYSGTPLPKKLGIKEGDRVALIAMPIEVRSSLRDAFSKCRISKELSAPLDFIHIFSKSHVELERDMKRASKALAPAGMVWISWPKKASRVETDLTEDIVRATGIALGLVDVKVCAVTEVWSGLKFVIPVKNRPKIE
jgi:bifunctional DNA-binding transcriptional regulator/antitoxin component of YhaV-PrlF toxin-antitoxin module